MNAWLLAAIALIPPLGVAMAMCTRGPVGARLVAVQFAAAIAVPLLVTLTFALAEASSIDLALALVLLGLPATLLFAVFTERWL